MARKRKQHLILVRHGQSVANLALQESRDGLYFQNAGSDVEIDLTPLGIEQSAARGRRLAKLFCGKRRIDRMWLTRFKRVGQSADAIAAALPYDIERQEDSRLEKRSYGDFWNLTYKGVDVLHPHEHERFMRTGKLLYRPPGGENYQDVFARVHDFLEELDGLPGNHLIVTHSVVILSFMRAFGEIDDHAVVRMYENVEFPNGGMAIYTRLRGRRGGPRAH
ncbi:MAG: histidine phosphatase family protein, partial [Chloroflexi bacterium]|nr:histidine phosphatase family protein [Chloroflexota bacterium]